MKLKLALDLRVDAHSPIPIRRQLTEQLKHAIEGGGVPREQALPSIRELAGFLAINPNTVARAYQRLTDHVPPGARHALFQVCVEDREIIVLKDVEELPFDEIRERTGRPVTALKIRAVRARARLRQALAKLAPRDAL